MMSHEDGWDDVTRTIVDMPAPVAEAPRNQAYLIVLAGSRVGEMVRVGPGGVSIGRGTDAEFRVADHGVSRIHLRVLQQKDGSVIVKDEGSRNGTFVNGERISEVVLVDGDKIHFGSTAILKFSYADKLEESFQQQMYEAALRDPLTRLFNRRHLLAQLEIEYLYTQRHGSPLTLILIDIDHFKNVNDTHGHPVGDAVLVGFADCLRSTVRGEDFAARYGGEEFAVVCRGIRSQVGFRVADRLREQIAGLSLVSDIPDLRISVSAGVACIPDPRFSSAEELIEASDKALYEAKRTGRNRVCVTE